MFCVLKFRFCDFDGFDGLTLYFSVWGGIRQNFLRFWVPGGTSWSGMLFGLSNFGDLILVCWRLGGIRLFRHLV